SRHHLRLTPSVTCLYPHHGLDRYLHSSPTRRSSDLERLGTINTWLFINGHVGDDTLVQAITTATEAKTRALHDLDIRDPISNTRSEEHTSELQSRFDLVCRLLLEKKKVYCKKTRFKI